MAYGEIDNRQDVMDSRNVEERICELQSERESLVDAVKEIETELEESGDEADTNEIKERLDEARKALTDWDESSEADELKHLEAFKADLEGYCEWEDGAILVRDTYFEDHAREEAEEYHGKAIRDAKWPFDCIDWERAADALKMDYTSGEFDGVTYWAR